MPAFRLQKVASSPLNGYQERCTKVMFKVLTSGYLGNLRKGPHPKGSAMTSSTVREGARI